jgi:hypothetical protein
MAERPIIMTGESVRAILAGTKSQTRRVNGLEDVNRYPGLLTGDSQLGPLGYRGLAKSDYYISTKKDYKNNPGLYHWFLGMQEKELNPIPVKCPYGQPGDKLWLREKYAVKPGTSDCVWYASDFEDCDAAGESMGIKWRSPMFMPRKFSRITLEVVSVRVERVQDISYRDLFAEGNYQPRPEGWLEWELREEYQTLWDSINKKRGYPWSANNWVWVIEFCKVEPAQP